VIKQEQIVSRKLADLRQPEKNAKDALVLAAGRANMALDGVPEETRDPLPDGTTRYSRPLPGAARMYLETDVPPMPISKERLDRIAKGLPELPEVTEARLVKQYGINAQQACQIVFQGRDDVFCRIVDEFGMAAVAATTFQNTFSEMEHEGIDTGVLTYDDIYGVFAALKANRFAKEAVPALLKEMASGTDLDKAVEKLGLVSVDAGEAEAVIASIVKEREEFVRSKGMAAVGPLMGLVMGALRGKIDGKQASDILMKEIKKLLG